MNYQDYLKKKAQLLEIKDNLFFRLNRTARYTKEWDILESRITKTNLLIEKAEKSASARNSRTP